MKKIDLERELEVKYPVFLGITFAILLAVLSVLASSLGCSAAPEPLDPTGVWNTTLTWSSGDCGFTGTRHATATVARVGDSYAVDEHGASVRGSVTCTTDRCRLVFTETGLAGVGTMTLKVDLVVDDTDAITGAGTASLIEEDRACTHAFLATGTLLR